MHALKRPERAYPMHVLNVKFMQLPSSSLNGPTGPVLQLFCSRDNTRSKGGQIENFIRILRCFEAEPVLPEGKYRSSSKVHYVLQLFSQLWHHCLSMFSASRLEGFGGRKSDHVIFGLICLWLLEYTTSTQVLGWDPQTRNDGWVGAWSDISYSSKILAGPLSGPADLIMWYDLIQAALHLGTSEPLI
jgi:hypothetical protein